MAWLGTYTYRRKITVDNTNIDSDLTHFPVPVVLGTNVGQSAQDVSDIFDEVGASYLKTAITKVDGTTQIYGDVEVWDSGNEKAVIHVAKSDLDITTAAVTELYIYYDATQADNITYIGLSGGTPAQSVYDSNYKAVLNMSQDPNGDVADSILDSTSNNNNGTPSGSMTTADLVDGTIGKSIAFDGTDDKITSSANVTATTDITVEAVGVFVSQTAGYERLCETRYDTGFYLGTGLDTTLTTDEPAAFIIHGTFLEPTLGAAIDKTDSHYYAGVYDSSNIGLYIDGVSSGTTAETDPMTVNPLVISYDGVEDGYSNNIINYIRISDSVRSADWIKATYYALTDDLIVFGNIEPVIISHPETTIETSVLSDLQINISVPELSIPIVVTNPSLFVGVPLVIPEVTIPITVGIPDVNIIIVQPEITIPIVVANPIPNLILVSIEAILNISIAEPAVTTFSMAGTVIRYLLTITGSADSLADVELPMSSFQARRKSGEATYLSVVVPTIDYAAEIAARSNGTIKVEQAYTLDGEYVQRELILEAEIDNIRTYQGGRNQSVVLEGYKTTTYVAKSMTLTTSTYKALSGGKLRYRVAKPNVFLNPGDTVTIDSDTFIIGTMSYAISPTMQQIELEEA